MYKGKIVNVNTCPGFPQNQVKLIKRLTSFLREKFHSIRHLKRATPFLGEEYAGILALVSQITHQPYKFVSKFWGFIRNFMQFAPVQGPIVGDFISSPVEIDLTERIHIVAKMREDLLCSGYLKHGDRTIYMGGIDKNNEGVFETKKAYRVVKQSVFKDSYFVDLFRILRYEERYWNQIKKGVYDLMGIGGVNEYFVRVAKKSKKKSLYHDNWTDIVHYRFHYTAQIPERVVYVAPSFSDFIGRITSHMVMQCYEIHIIVEGRGRIIVGEQPFNDAEIAYSTSVICDGERVFVASQECKEMFHQDIMTDGKPMVINWRIPSSLFKMRMKRLKLEFQGIFKVHKMSICCRVWDTGSVCIADYNTCARQCVMNPYRRCNKGGECMRAPLSACSICRSALLNTLYHYSDNHTPQGLVQYMSLSREYREGLDVLKDDQFFFAYKHMVRDCLPIQNRLVSFARDVGALFVSCQVISCLNDKGEEEIFKKCLMFEFSTRSLKEERVYSNFNSFQKLYHSLSDTDWVIICQVMKGHLHQEIIKRLATRENDILIL